MSRGSPSWASSEHCHLQVLGSCSSRRGRQLKEPGRQLGEAGRASSFVYHEGDTVIQLQNVQLVEDGFIYYHDGSSPLPPADLSSVLVHQFWEGLTAGRQVQAHPPWHSSCCKSSQA